MTPTVTSTTTRAVAPQDNSVEYVNPNARTRDEGTSSSVSNYVESISTPLVQGILLVAPEGQKFVRNSKIFVGNSAGGANLGGQVAYVRALPEGFTSITFPRTSVQPSEEVIFSVDNEQQSQSRNVGETSQAVSSYQRAGDITFNQEFAINAIA